METFDAETDQVANNRFGEQAKNKQVEQSLEAVALLDRQMAEIQKAIGMCYLPYFKKDA